MPEPWPIRSSQVCAVWLRFELRGNPRIRILSHHFLAQPGFGKPELSAHHMHGHGHRQRGLLGSHAGEIPHLNQLSLAWVCFFQLLKRSIDCLNGSICFGYPIRYVGNCQFACGVTLCGGPGPGNFHKNLPHEPRSDPKEVRSILIRRMAALGQSQESFMDQGSGFKRNNRFAPQMCPC